MKNELVHGAYPFFMSTDAPLDRELIENVWHIHIPLKVCLPALRLLRNRLPTRDNLARRRVIHEDHMLCPAGCGFNETTDDFV